MKPEPQLAEFVTGLQAGAAPAATLQTVQRVLMACVGTGVAGSGEDGLAELRQLLLSRGGRPEAHALVYGDALPAHAAAQLNGTMCRALDFCDAMAPGAHFGSSVVPAAFAAAELAGGCSGADFLAGLLAGCEIGARFNLTESMYNGFDPTGVASVFAATAAAARILQLTERQTLNALGLAFNRCGGSFQSNVDGSLGVRIVQGWVAQTGIECVQMALCGLTGPENFLTGVYGYCHLFGRDRLDAAEVTAGLGSQWRTDAMVFKRFPSCGATQGMTGLVLQLVHELQLEPRQVEHVEVRLNPYCHRLVGDPFRFGTNPRVNAQFSAQYCVANAIVRGASKLVHFTPEQVADPVVQGWIERVSCFGDPALDPRGHSAVDVTLTTIDGERHRRQLDVPPGFAGNPLTEEEHLARFNECMEYAPRRPSPQQVGAFLEAVGKLSALPDAREIVRMLIVPTGLGLAD
jgi:2-methylcitrate dehydratase PrpD